MEWTSLSAFNATLCARLSVFAHLSFGCVNPDSITALRALVFRRYNSTHHHYSLYAVKCTCYHTQPHLRPSMHIHAHCHAHCLCGSGVTVTSLRPPRLCRLAVFSIKPTLLSTHIHAHPRTPSVSALCQRPCFTIMRSKFSASLVPAKHTLRVIVAGCCTGLVTQDGAFAEGFGARGMPFALTPRQQVGGWRTAWRVAAASCCWDWR